MSRMSNQRRWRQSPGGQLLAKLWVIKLHLKLSSEGECSVWPKVKGSVFLTESEGECSVWPQVKGSVVSDRKLYVSRGQKNHSLRIVNFCFKIIFKIGKNSLDCFGAVVTLTMVFFQKNSQATRKCDAERNWSTYDFIHSKIEEKTGQQR